MTETIEPVPQEQVPAARNRTPFRKPVADIAKELMASPGEWFIIGDSTHAKRSRLNNAASLLANGRYRALREACSRGRFETRVSGSRHAPHAAQHDVVVFARYLPAVADTEDAE